MGVKSPQPAPREGTPPPPPAPPPLRVHRSDGFPAPRAITGRKPGIIPWIIQWFSGDTEYVIRPGCREKSDDGR